jgi:DNA repair exonuclease SbcCD ATPase subunit
MNINSIAAKNFKGLSFSFGLGLVNIVTGGNFTGKTAILDAIRVGLMGYMPALGKQPSSTYKLAGAGDEMTVNVGTAETEISHKWKPNSKGVSYEGALPWETPAVLLDTREYLNKPAAEKLAAVLRLCNPEELGYSDSGLMKQLADIEVLPMKHGKPAVDRMLSEVTQSMSERGKASIQDWITELMELFKRNAKQQADDSKRASATIAALKVTSGVTPDSVAPKLAEATTERDTLAGKIQAVESLLTQQASGRAKEQGLKDELLTFPDMSKEMDTLAEKVKSLKHDNASEAFKMEVVGYRNKINTLSAGISRAVMEIDKMTSPEQLECCPHCGSNQPGWNAKLAEKYYADEKALKTQIDTLKKERAEVEAKLATAKSNFDAAAKTESQIDADHEKALGEFYKLKERQQRRERVQSELDGIQSVLSKQVETDASIDEMKTKLAALNESVSKLQLQQNEFEIADRDRQKRNEAEEKSIQNITASKVYKEAASKLKTMQEDIVEHAFSKLLVKARAFTDGLLRSPLVYMEGNLGMMNGDAFVSWETFSGTEELIAFAGLSVALCQSAPIKVVLMDELGRLTADNKHKLVLRMRELTKSGIIDNFVGVDVVAEPYAGLEGVNIIKV